MGSAQKIEYTPFRLYGNLITTLVMGLSQAEFFFESLLIFVDFSGIALMIIVNKSVVIHKLALVF